MKAAGELDRHPRHTRHTPGTWPHIFKLTVRPSSSPLRLIVRPSSSPSPSPSPPASNFRLTDCLVQLSIPFSPTNRAVARCVHSQSFLIRRVPDSLSSPPPSFDTGRAPRAPLFTSPRPWLAFKRTHAYLIGIAPDVPRHTYKQTPDRFSKSPNSKWPRSRACSSMPCSLAPP